MTDIIRYTPAPKDGSRNDGIDIFGKCFSIPAKDDALRIVVHLDYPRINNKDIKSFSVESLRISKPLISCRRACVHPYRLMFIGRDGYDKFLLEVPQEIRGNRHLYPHVFEIVPALIAIPPAFDVHRINTSDEVAMFEMVEEKLFDKTKPVDRLLINCMKERRTQKPVENLR